MSTRSTPPQEKSSWSYETGHEIYSSPTVADGIVYIGSNDGFLYALHGDSGKLHWRYFTAGPVESSPTVVDDVVYVASGGGHLHALDAASGELIWRAWTGAVRKSTPAVADGVVYVGSLDGHLYALDAASGERLWRYKAVHNNAVYKSEFISSCGRWRRLLHPGQWIYLCP